MKRERLSLPEQWRSYADRTPAARRTARASMVLGPALVLTVIIALCAWGVHAIFF